MVTLTESRASALELHYLTFWSPMGMESSSYSSTALYLVFYYHISSVAGGMEHNA